MPDEAGLFTVEEIEDIVGYEVNNKLQFIVYGARVFGRHDEKHFFEYELPDQGRGRRDG